MINNEKNLFQKKVNKNYYIFFLVLVMFVLIVSLNVGGVLGAEIEDEEKIYLGLKDDKTYSEAWIDFVKERVIDGDETRSQLWDYMVLEKDKIGLLKDICKKSKDTKYDGIFFKEEANLLFKELTLEQRKEVVKLITGKDDSIFSIIKGLDSEDLTLDTLDNENLILKNENGAYVNLDTLSEIKEISKNSIDYTLKQIEYTDTGLVYTYGTTLGKENGEVKITLQGIGTIKENGEYTNPEIEDKINIFPKDKKIDFLAGTQGEITVTQNGLINLDNGAIIKYGDHKIKQFFTVENRYKKGYQNYIPENYDEMVKNGKDLTGVVNIGNLGIDIEGEPAGSPIDSSTNLLLKNIILDSKEGTFFFSRKKSINFIFNTWNMDNTARIIDKRNTPKKTDFPYIIVNSNENGMIIKGNTDNYVGFVAKKDQKINEIDVKSSNGERYEYSTNKRGEKTYTNGAFYFRNGGYGASIKRGETHGSGNPQILSTNVGEFKLENGKLKVEGGLRNQNKPNQVTVMVKKGDTNLQEYLGQKSNNQGVFTVDINEQGYVKQIRLGQSSAIIWPGEATINPTAKRLQGIAQTMTTQRTKTVEQAVKKSPEIKEDIEEDGTKPSPVRVIQTPAKPKEPTTTKGIEPKTTPETPIKTPDTTPKTYEELIEDKSDPFTKTKPIKKEPIRYYAFARPKSRTIRRLFG